MNEAVQELISCWDECAESYDDLIGAHEELLKLVVNGEEQNNQIFKLVTYFRELKDTHASFFDHFHFEWCLHMDAFKTATEAEFNGRIMHMLYPLWETQQDWILDLNLHVAVRYAITPKTLTTFPRAFKHSNFDFIVYPINAVSGWYYKLLEAIELSKIEDAQRAIKYFLLRLLSDNFVHNSIFTKQLYDLNPMEIYTHSRAISMSAVENISYFKNASDEGTRGHFINLFWSDASYLATNFGLAHELAHILKGEHLPGQSAIEINADQFGLKLLEQSDFYRHTLHTEWLRDKDYLAKLSYWIFIETVFLQRLCEYKLLGPSAVANIEEIGKRKSKAEAVFSDLKHPDQKKIIGKIRCTTDTLQSLFEDIISQMSPIQATFIQLADKHFVTQRNS